MRHVDPGMGITSCLGNSLDEVAESLHEGKSGITFSEEYENLGRALCGIFLHFPLFWGFSSSPHMTHISKIFHRVFWVQPRKYGIKSQVRGVPELTTEEIKKLIPRKALRFMGRNAQLLGSCCGLGFRV